MESLDRLLSFYIRANSPYGHTLLDDEHRVLRPETVILLQIGIGVGYPMGAIQKERILIRAWREEKFDFPCVSIPLETVNIGRPPIEITAEADCLTLSHIGEYNRHLAGRLMNHVPVPSTCHRKY